MVTDYQSGILILNLILKYQIIKTLDYTSHELSNSNDYSTRTLPVYSSSTLQKGLVSPSQTTSFPKITHWESSIEN